MGGAEAADGTFESNINLSIVQKLQKLLESSACTVILTRSDENGIYESDSNTNVDFYQTHKNVLC